MYASDTLLLGETLLGGDRKGTGLISPALCSGLATMSGASSGDDSEPVPEVPSDLGMSLVGMGSRGLRVRRYPAFPRYDFCSGRRCGLPEFGGRAGGSC